MAKKLAMKTAIHPTYYADALITCACGNKMSIGSTVKDIHVEICAGCHPFYTGKQKLVDTAQRVEKFHGKVKRQKVESQVRRGRKAKHEARAQKKIAENTGKEVETVA